ncbi:MAG: transcription elongation factor GreA [Chloroflexota bacterium]
MAEHLTQEGYQRFVAELNYLQNVRRREVAARLRQTLEEGGDLVENAEFEDAKNEQAFVEGRIQQLDNLLREAIIIEDEISNGTEKVVRLNSVVTVREEGFDDETFRIVGRAEANPRKGMISDESPLGRALLGKEVGQSVMIDAPDGQFEYQIISIN